MSALLTNADTARLSRPWAQAAFNHAIAHKQTEQWLDNLNQLSYLSRLAVVADILQDPRYTPDIKAQVFLILVPQLDSKVQNFIQSLAQNRRLALLSDIYNCFKQLLDAHQQTVHVFIKSAVLMQKSQLQRLRHLLCKRLQQNIVLNHAVDTQLIGGFVVSFRDQVWDHSIRGRLEAMRRGVCL